jgi:hypothetical protein
MTTMPQLALPDSRYTLVDDAWNRLMKVTNASDSTTVIEHEYDACDDPKGSSPSGSIGES